MDHTYQHSLQMPASYCVLSQDEMTYTEGGAFGINITQEQVISFGVNFTVNLLTVMGRYAFQYTVNGIQNGLADGLTVGGVLGHYWGKLNGWSKAATIGLAGLGGYYAYIQAVSLYRSVKNLYIAFRDSIAEIREEQQAQQEAAQQAALQPTLAVA